MSSPDLRFDAFIDGLVLSPEELAAARQAAMMVAAQLRRAFYPDATASDERSDHLVAGAVGKRIAIRPLTSVDLLYLLPAGSQQADVLLRMEGVLRAALPAAPLDFGDGRLLVEIGSIPVAVHPAVEHHGGFAIPGSQGWMLTNPAAEMAALRLSDSLNGGLTTRFLALLKAWRLACAVPVGSFALEILAREFISECNPPGWPARLSDFFAWLRQRTPKQYALPGGLGNLHIDDACHPAAEAAYWRAVLAQRHAASGDEPEELAEWRHLLGRHFGRPPAFNIWNVRQDL